MKRSFLVAGLLSLALLAGCGETPEQTNTQASSSPQPTIVSTATALTTPSGEAEQGGFVSSASELDMPMRFHGCTVYQSESWLGGLDQNSGNLYLYPHGEPDNFFVMLSITPAGDAMDGDMHDETFQKEFMAEFGDGFQDYNLISTDSGEWKGKNIFIYECQGSEQGMALTIRTTMFLHNGNMYSVGLLSDVGITGADRASLDAFLEAIELHDDDVDPSLPGIAPSAVGGEDAISAAFPEIVESDDASLDKLHALAEASFELLVGGLPEGMETIQSIGWLADDEGTAAVGVYLQVEPDSSSANAMAASLLYDIRTFDEEQVYDGDVFIMYMMHTSQFDKAVAVGGYNAEELTVYYVDLNRSLVGSFTCGPDEIEDRMKEVGY